MDFSAPKPCAKRGCTEMVVEKDYCTAHAGKGWHKSYRVVPSDWKQRIAVVLQRDGRICHVCRGGGADEVDHLLNVARGGTHDLANLAAIHAVPCHQDKTKREAAEGVRRYRAQAKHPVERHPGLLP